MKTISYCGGDNNNSEGDNEESDKGDIKCIQIVPDKATIKAIKQKERKKRVITQTDRWTSSIFIDDLTITLQKNILTEFSFFISPSTYTTTPDTTTPEAPLEATTTTSGVGMLLPVANLVCPSTPPEAQQLKKMKLLKTQFRRKIDSYRAQDLKKKIHDPPQFITLPYIVDLLMKTPLCCYCHETVLFFYENVREPRQWTLDRIDNAHGHNIENVQIACLSCNLKRRTTLDDDFVFTKLCEHIQKVG